MRQHQIFNLARIVVLPLVMSGLLLIGCDAKPPSKKELAALTAADHKAAFEKKLATFRQKAEAGDAVAQLEMGRAYAQGLAWAVKLPAGAAALEQKDPLVDLKKAEDWYKKAAKQGNAEAQYWMGMLWLPNYFDQFSSQQQLRDPYGAATWFEKAAKQKHAGAAYQLARIYEFGNGVARNSGRAYDNYNIAAELGYAEAQYRMGWFYKGRVPITGGMELIMQPDLLVPGTAAEWWSKAAAQGHVDAQGQLGHLYHNGEGVPKDPVQGNEWWRKAADQGDANAQSNLGVSYSAGLGLPKDQSKAVEWYLKSAMQGEQVGQSNLAHQYGAGDGVDKDLILAYAWFNLAAANPQGNEYITNDAKKWRARLEDLSRPLMSQRRNGFRHRGRSGRL